MNYLACALPMPDRKKPGPKPTKTTQFAEWRHASWQGDNKSLAVALGISVSYLEKLIHGRDVPGITLALQIKTFTKGALDLDALCDPSVAFHKVA